MPSEASEWLGPGDGWQGCLTATGGMPLAPEIWNQTKEEGGEVWCHRLVSRLVADRPPHIGPDLARTLAEEWLSGRLSLPEFSHQISCGQPAAEQLWTEVAECRQLYADHPPAARERLNALWETARGRGDQPLMGAVALLQGEVHQALGEYGQAMEWYRQAFEADPDLELCGAHAMVLILRDQGHLEEAERLARRCIQARTGRGDLLALGLAHLWYGCICLEFGRLDEAESEFVEANRLGGKLFGEPVVGLLSTTHLALLQAHRGNATAFRQLAEEAYSRARGRWRWFEALCGHVLASALVVWGESERAEKIMSQSFEYLSSIKARWHLHVALTVMARKEWRQGKPEQARAYFDQALELAARESYTRYLHSPRSMATALIVDALTRGVETSFCSDILAGMGEQALPALLELAARPDPQARRSAVYPLSAIGGEQAIDVLRRLLRDDDEVVRDRAFLALKAATPLKAWLPVIRISRPNARSSTGSRPTAFGNWPLKINRLTERE